MKKQQTKQKILLAMSGGVDSSVAALLLKKQGYNVIGAFMKNWSDTKDLAGQCIWRGERKFAIKIAAKLNIPLITLDFEKQYKKQVIEEMFKKYKKGITPNPDIDCNQKIKFPLLIKEAKKRGINLIATGHYARIKKKKIKFKKLNNKNYLGGRAKFREKGDGGEKFSYELLRAKDESKDQSYFLYRIKQNELKHTLFPVGNYTKKQIREIAKKNKFPNYNKKSTTGICFIGKINLKNFLKKKIKTKKGKVLDPQGNIIGEHDGIYYYTIGQRLGPRYGFEISRNSLQNEKNLSDNNLKKSRDAKQAQPSSKGRVGGNNLLKNKKLQRWYVAKKIPKTNTIIAAPKNHLLNFRKEIIVKNFHLISDNKDRFKNKTSKIFARIRHVGELLPSRLFYKNKKWEIVLNKAIMGISEGQAVVLYQGKKCLGGGEIGF